MKKKYFRYLQKLKPRGIQSVLMIVLSVSFYFNYDNFGSDPVYAIFHSVQRRYGAKHAEADRTGRRKHGGLSGEYAPDI